MDVLAGSLSSAQVCARAGVTYRQLDHWSRLGLVRPTVDSSGSGTQRQWDATSVAVVAVAGRLARLGAPAHVRARAGAAVAEMATAQGWMVVEALGASVSVHVGTDLVEALKARDAASGSPLSHGAWVVELGVSEEMLDDPASNG
jgi:Na+(H+)/acetate symporter ActP